MKNFTLHCVVSPRLNSSHVNGFGTILGRQWCFLSVRQYKRPRACPSSTPRFSPTEWCAQIASLNQCIQYPLPAFEQRLVLPILCVHRADIATHAPRQQHTLRATKANAHVQWCDIMKGPLLEARHTTMQCACAIQSPLCTKDKGQLVRELQAETRERWWAREEDC